MVDDYLDELFNLHENDDTETVETEPTVAPVDELLAVRGIGTKTLEKIRAAATC